MQLATKGAGLWITPDRLSVSVDQVTGCEDGFRDTISTTQVTTYQTKNVALEGVAGAVLLTAGGTALLAAPSLSDQKSSSDEVSPRENANVWGVVGAVGGAILLGHALYIAGKGADEVSDPTTTTERRSAGGPLRPCGTQPAGPGSVVALVDGRSIDLGMFKNGSSLIVEPRAAASRLCDDPADADKTAKLKYVLTQDPDLDVQLSVYPLRRCVAALAAQKRLAAADAALSNAQDGPTIVWALDSLHEARVAIGSLPADDDERLGLTKRLLDLEAKVKLRAVPLSRHLAEQARSAIDSDFARSVEPTTAALKVSRFAGDDPTEWPLLYKAFTAKAKGSGLQGYAAVQHLMQADGFTWACLSIEKGCPAGVSASDMRSILGPSADGAGVVVAKASDELSVTAKALENQVNAKNLQRADRALENVRPSREICVQPELVSPLDARCVSFLDADRRLSATLSARSDDVSRVRTELAETERRARTQRVASAWRQHFSECSQLTSAVRQLQAVSSCDTGCQQVLQRIRAQKERLAGFRLEDPIEDPALEDHLRQECGRAGCEVCP